MSGFAKLTVKALRALAEEYEVQLPAGRITKNGLIEILEAENIQPPWDGPDWKCPTPASLMRAGLLLGIAPRPIWRAVQARWPDYKGASGRNSIESPWRAPEAISLSARSLRGKAGSSASRSKASGESRRTRPPPSV